MQQLSVLLTTSCLSIDDGNRLRLRKECSTFILQCLMFLEELRVVVNSRRRPGFTVTSGVQVHLQPTSSDVLVVAFAFS